MPRILKFRKDGTVIDLRRGGPLREVSGTWAQITMLDVCPFCSTSVSSTRAWECKLLRCPECTRFFAVKLPRILKIIK